MSLRVFIWELSGGSPKEKQTPSTLFSTLGHVLHPTQLAIWSTDLSSLEPQLTAASTP